MVHDARKEAAKFIESALTEPLGLPDLPPDLTLLGAALSFKDEAPGNTTIQKVMQAFLDYPEANQALLRELKIISEELRRNR